MSAEPYELVACIGSGNFGDVYKALGPGKQVFAIKVINLDESKEDLKVLIQEIQFLSKMNNRYITKYFESFVEGTSMFIVMEYCGGGSCGDLLKYCKQLLEELTGLIIKDVLQGLVYLHQEQKVHRDIKLANILLTEDGEVKLADFGVSGEITLTHFKRKTFVGTPFWMAPEVIARGKVGNKGYDFKADIWSLGITTIELVTGSPPLSQYDPMKILFEIPKNRPPVLTGKEYGDNIKDFVKYCLIKDPSKRPTARRLLHHQFITDMKYNGAARMKLVKLITTKNLKTQNGQLSKIPRHKITSDTFKREIEWDFNTFKTVHSGVTQNCSSGSDVPKATQELTNSEMLFYCLQLVYNRGLTEETRSNVQSLINILLEYESRQPGLCEAIVEEMEQLLKH